MKQRQAFVDPSLSPPGEFLSFDIEGEGERVYLFNPRLALDERAVDWTATQGRLGSYWNLALNKDWIPVPAIFWIPKLGDLYLSTQLEDNEKDFFHLYKKHGWTGLYFKKLWDEHEGPVPGRTVRPQSS